MNQRRIIVFGDSHTLAIEQATNIRKKKKIENNVEVYRLFRKKKGGEVLGKPYEECLEAVSSLGEGDLAVSIIGGNQHHILSLVQHPVPFDFIDIEGANMNENAQMIPYSAVFDTMELAVLRKNGKALKQFSEVARCRLVHCAPPPPKEDEDHIMGGHVSDFAAKGLFDTGISPAALRLKVWNVQVKVLQRLCAELGMELLMPPPDARTAGGFLKPEYYANDATHANAAYGELVLRQLERFAQDNVPVGA